MSLQIGNELILLKDWTNHTTYQKNIKKKINLKKIKIKIILLINIKKALWKIMTFNYNEILIKIQKQFFRISL
jgi:hypothetical protein